MRPRRVRVGLRADRAKSFRSVGGNGIGDLEDGARGAVVDVQGDRDQTVEVIRRVEKETWRSAAKTVDGLGVVADHRDARVVAAKAPQHVQLQEVHVLEFVDQHVVIARRQRRSQGVILDGGAPKEQKVIEVQETERTLAIHEG